MLADRILRLIENPASADPGEFERLMEAARSADTADTEKVSVGLGGAAFEKSLADLLPPGRLPVLALTPGPETLSSTSQSPLVEHLLKNRGASESLRAFGRRGVEIAAGRSWLAARQRDRKPALVVAHSSALADLLQTLARRHLKFRLPHGSTVLDLVTSGEPWCPADLVQDSLAAAERLVRVYTPAGGVTPFVARERGASEPPVFQPPAWTRVRIAEGQPGHLMIFDLAVFEDGGSVEIATRDAATATTAGFQLA
ncbi:MAG: hypothetical protein OES47_15070 [Acidobacteriota bacterium]|nr:hypothetical protein [Acidobacteriota bacterium]